jgi:hypothetical protein
MSIAFPPSPSPVAGRRSGSSKLFLAIDVITTILAAVAVAIVGVAIAGRIAERPPSSPDDPTVFISEFQSGIRLGRPFGRARALIQFSSPCVQCESLFASLDTLMDRYPDHVQVSWSPHDRKNGAAPDSIAVVGICAAQLGYGHEYLRSLFSGKDMLWMRTKFESSARRDSLRDCIRQQPIARPVLSDAEHPLPALFVNAKRIPVNLSSKELDSVLARELRPTPTNSRE